MLPIPSGHSSCGANIWAACFRSQSLDPPMSAWETGTIKKPSSAMSDQKRRQAKSLFLLRFIPIFSLDNDPSPFLRYCQRFLNHQTAYHIKSYHITHKHIYIYVDTMIYIIYINPIISNFLRRNPLVFRWWCQESIPGAHRYWRWAHLPPPHRAKWCSPDAHLLWDGDPNAKPKRATGIPNIIRLVWGILVGGNYSLDMFRPSNQILYTFGDVLHIFA